MNVNKVSRIIGTKYKSLAVVEGSLKLLEFSSLVLHTSLFSGYIQVLSRGSGSSGLILSPRDFSPFDCVNDADLRILAIRGSSTLFALSLGYAWSSAWKIRPVKHPVHDDTRETSCGPFSHCPCPSNAPPETAAVVPLRRSSHQTSALLFFDDEQVINIQKNAVP